MSFRSFLGWLAPALALIVTVAGCSGQVETAQSEIPLRPSLEDVAPDGSPYAPGTQSLLRGNHWLESVPTMRLGIDGKGRVRARLEAEGDLDYVEFVAMPLEYLLPALHYRPAQPPDRFDGFNLMLAEFSRTGVSVPIGEPADSMAHFETSLQEGFPWKLAGDYEFLPNPGFQPVRMGLVNNCLRPGLWEIFGKDRSGEIYHAWFDFPTPLYLEAVAEKNRLALDFVQRSLEWNSEPAALDLERLRRNVESLGAVELALAPDETIGYSSQDSRRKLKLGFVLIEKAGPEGETSLSRPERLSELTTHPVHMSNFDEPGKYRIDARKRFDLRFLARAISAEVFRVSPLTDFASDRPGRPPERSGEDYLEVHLELRDHTIVLGNLPLHLLVPQADFAIHGFGVGVLPSEGFAERRKILFEQGPAPSFAYLCMRQDGPLMGLNSHEFGLEQVFIRTHLTEQRAWWQVTLTSYERIVDLVKYEVEIPDALRKSLEEARLRYIDPLYRSYRDDNLR